MPKCSQNSRKSTRRGEFYGSINKQHKINNNFYRLIIDFEDPAAECLAHAQAGQFVQIGLGELSDARALGAILRRPFSIAGLNHPIKKTSASGTIQLEIIYQVLGPGTQCLAVRKTGEKISIIGPLGNGFSLPDETSKKVILIGGGVGLPPMYFWAEQLIRAGYSDIVGFAGARKKKLFAGILLVDKYQSHEPLLPQHILNEFSRSGAGCVVATDDGSFGFAGSVVRALENFLDYHPDWKNAYLYACGPYGMLKALAALAQRLNMPCEVCMEAYMACGFGVCQSCVVPTRNTKKTDSNAGEPCYKLVCSDGPVFDAQHIQWQ